MPPSALASAFVYPRCIVSEADHAQFNAYVGEYSVSSEYICGKIVYIRRSVGAVAKLWLHEGWWVVGPSRSVGTEGVLRLCKNRDGLGIHPDDLGSAAALAEYDRERPWNVITAGAAPVLHVTANALEDTMGFGGEYCLVTSTDPRTHRPRYSHASNPEYHLEYEQHWTNEKWPHAPSWVIVVRRPGAPKGDFTWVAKCASDTILPQNADQACWSVKRFLVGQTFQAHPWHSALVRIGVVQRPRSSSLPVPLLLQNEKTPSPKRPRASSDGAVSSSDELVCTGAEPRALLGMDIAALRSLERTYFDGLSRIREKIQELEVQDKRCPICLDDALPRDHVLVPCGHAFCEPCATRQAVWTETAGKCAICKSAVSFSMKAFM